jgi:hypothetical protein
MLYWINSNLAQECLSFLYGGIVRPSKKIAWAAGGPRPATDYQANLQSDIAPLATSREIFAYGHAVAAAIPRLPHALRPSTVRHLLSVLHAGLTRAAP